MSTVILSVNAQQADSPAANVDEAIAAHPLDNPALVESFVDGVVQPLMKNNSSPSGTVAIMRNGEMLLAKGYGFEDVSKQKPVDPYTTLFRPGSVSKLFTWVSVMQMVEQGKLDLDADVNTYLETLQIKDTFDRPVTLRDIMTHSAGFEDGGLGYLIIEDPDRAIPLADAMKRYQPKRVNPPGAQTAYSNYATSLAGLMVANLSGLSFQDYVQQKIFDPLAMHSSSFVEPLPEALAAHMATSYSPEGGHFVEKPFEIISSFAPAGAQSATSTDMVRFAQAILNGGQLDGNRILEQETVDQMLTRNFSHDDRLMGMALGFYETDYNGFRVMGHGGDTAWFHSYLGIDKVNDLVFFVSFGAPGGGAVRTSFAQAFYDEFFPRHEAPPVPPEGFKERAAKYAGTYGFWRGNFSTLEKALGLASVIQVAPTEDDTLAISLGGSAKQYAEVEDNLFREMSPNFSLLGGMSPRLLAFQENDRGAVTGFVIDGLPFMSTRKLAVYETPGFNFTLLGLSLLILLLVLLRRFFQRKALRELPGAERTALNSAAYAAVANLLVVVVGVIVISVVSSQLGSEIPTLLKLWLVLPIVATLAGLYLLFRTVGVWRQKLFTGFWARSRFTLITLSGLFMGWFYYFWNILGFQYYS
jgi:CubicO group peptidase (beta-lactamase class C family)